MTRTEHDLLGSLEVENEFLYGIHTKRAVENFRLTTDRMHPVFIRSYAEVKLACAETNHELGYLEENIFVLIKQACLEIISGKHHDQFPVSPFQGGAGTSANMNLNEVIANRALEIGGFERGDYRKISPLDHVNMHQSTNDTFPSAMKIAILHMLVALEEKLAFLQEETQKKESEFREIVKLGRTQLMDAVPVTLGMEISAWAEALSRDRWRIFKSRERIKTVCLGGTATGTGIGAPRQYILKVVQKLKEVSGLPVSRAENLTDGISNHDSVCEVSGMLRCLSVNLLKISTDLRILSSGPGGGIGEVKLPARQAGSTIMPGKVNPVIPEAVSQACLRTLSNDHLLSLAAGLGNLEINQFSPLICHSIMESLELMCSSCAMLSEFCIRGLEAETEKCRAHLVRSMALASLLVSEMSYEKMTEYVQKASEAGLFLGEYLVRMEIITQKRLEELLSYQNVSRLGSW